MELKNRLNRQSLGNQIATHLRQEIFLGRLAPGTVISQQSLCEQYGTSRMPVRDALVKLTNEGMITTTPGGHTVVAELTAEDILDAFDIESVVHGRAARRAVNRATDEEIDELEALHNAMLEAERENDLDRISELNWDFHKHINVCARSAKLLAVIRSVSLDIPRSYLVEMPDFASKTTTEHAAIVEAFKDRDPERAEELVQQHVRDAGINLVRHLEGKGLFAALQEARAS